MAKRPLKNRIQFTSTLTKENFAALKELSDTTKVPLSKLMDEAVELLLAKRN
jgi:hypothetical protein